jgi:hypothetical protein
VPKPKPYDERVWEGDPTTVREAREAYRKDPEANLIRLAVALYSFRANSRFAEELIELRFKLLDFIATGISVAAPITTPQEFADEADVLSTYLEWMSRRPELSLEAAGLRKAARDLIGRGQGLVHDLTHHNPYLLLLTEVRIMLAEGRRTNAQQQLAWMASHAPQIKDPKQRARVYRKMGMLNRRCGRWRSGWFWGIRACFVPEVPLDVRAKSVAALLGIDS